VVSRLLSSLPIRRLKVEWSITVAVFAVSPARCPSLCGRRTAGRRTRMTKFAYVQIVVSMRRRRSKHMGTGRVTCDFCGITAEGPCWPGTGADPAGIYIKRHVFNTHKDTFPTWVVTYRDYTAWDLGVLTDPSELRHICSRCSIPIYVWGRDIHGARIWYAVGGDTLCPNSRFHGEGHFPIERA